MRRKMLITTIILLTIGVLVTLLLNHPVLGRNPRGARLERVMESPHYVDGQFQNEKPTVLMTGKHSIWTSMGDMLTGRKKSPANKPKEGEVAVVKSNLKRLSLDKDQYIWFGHSSFLLVLSGKTILVDPVFYQFSPVPFIGTPFPGTDIYKPEDMPDKIDYLVISHDHYDHLEYKTVRELQERVGKVICPLGVGENFEYWGYQSKQIIELDWSEDYIDGITFHCLPTRHFSGRGIKRNTTQRASWVIETPNRKVFYSGDGGYDKRFERIGHQFPNLDLAIMENGQYDENWRHIHTMPSELGKELAQLKPKRFITVHHSKVALANHVWNEPRINEQQAARASGIPLIECKIGEILVLADD